MSWWSWVVVAYAGLFGLFTLAIAFTCVAVRLSARLQTRKLVCEAERFLADVAIAVDNV